MAVTWLVATISHMVARLYEREVPVGVVTAPWVIGLMAGPIAVGCSSLDRFLVAKEVIFLHTTSYVHHNGR